jgi:hypothetical protein
VAGAEGLRHKREEAALRVRSVPAPQRGTAAQTQLQRGGDALLASDAQQARTLAHDREDARARLVLGRPTAAGRQESESRTLLVRMPKPAPVGIALVAMRNSNLVHGRDGSRDVSKTTGNLT